MASSGPGWLFSLCSLFVLSGVLTRTTHGEPISLQLRSQQPAASGGERFQRVVRGETWPGEKSAVVVCDVWDLHHCLNAVRRLEEFAPRLNEVLNEARRRGAVIIHSPSDCMEAYADHPARRRAQAAPRAANLPAESPFWCSKIPAEEQAVYPIDQSDGGEDDDPAEHAQWVARLKALGRAPGTPWKKQSDRITIDEERDYVSDRGDEVWNILEQRGVTHVLLTGVHCNMCVLGRPFGLRQMVRHGKKVALMRDMTDSMYSPKRWPYVDHFTGNDLVISHVERFVCPTVTSDQLLGGQPFRWRADQRANRDVAELNPAPPVDRSSLERQWTLVTIPGSWATSTAGAIQDYQGVAWYRCSLRVLQASLTHGPIRLKVPRAATQGGADGGRKIEAWLNGHALSPEATNAGVEFLLPPDRFEANDANLLVVRVEHRAGDGGMQSAPTITGVGRTTSLAGRWQLRLGDDPSNSRIPLPARYGLSSDVQFEPFASSSK